jgi:hypothetical protein
MNFRIVLALALLAVQAAVVPALAQGVYVTPGKNGPVFSDKPQAGAKEVTLPPLNVIPPTKEPLAPAGAVPPIGQPPPDTGVRTPAEPAYRRFAIVYPEHDGSVLANTAVFEVRVDVDPPLLLGERHAFVVRLNGRPVGQRFTATEFMIPPEFWGSELPPPNQEMLLEASIVDGNGQVLMQAAPVRFFMRHARVLLPLPGVYVPRYVRPRGPAMGTGRNGRAKHDPEQDAPQEPPPAPGSSITTKRLD